MLKLVSWSFGLILSTSIVPLASLVISATVQAAENIEIKPAIANNAAPQTDRYAQMSNTDRRIIQENQRLQNSERNKRPRVVNHRHKSKNVLLTKCGVSKS
jgi:hypothetical protein